MIPQRHRNFWPSHMPCLCPPEIRVFYSIVSSTSLRPITQNIITVPIGISIKELKQQIYQSRQFEEIGRCLIFNREFAEYVDIDDSMLLMAANKVIFYTKEQNLGNIPSEIDRKLDLVLDELNSLKASIPSNAALDRVSAELNRLNLNLEHGESPSIPYSSRSPGFAAPQSSPIRQDSSTTWQTSFNTSIPNSPWSNSSGPIGPFYF